MTIAIPKFILASQSPRRKELLRQAGYEFEIITADIDEEIKEGESAKELVERLSFEKAKKVAELKPELWILGADTTVVINNEILNKPLSKEEAFLMLKKLQGNIHIVCSGITLYNLEDNRSLTKSYETLVKMTTLSDPEITRYIDTNEPMDKAGSYAIQGLGSKYIESINGSYTNVVGLNISGVREMFEVVLE